MANKIVVKHRSADIGEPSDLLAGEIAANINASGKQIFIGTGSGNIVFSDKTYVDNGFQPLNANLTDIAALSQAAGDMIRSNGSDFITLKNNISATAAPTATDDSGAGYAVGSVWLDTTNDKAYIAMDVTSTAAVWVEITQSALTDVVNDTTPQLGGDLDLNSNDITGTGNISITGTATMDGLTVDTNTLYVDAANNRVGIGTSSPSTALDVVGDLTLSGGVYLGGTLAANHLDDYEEGTWTPVLDSATNLSGTPAIDKAIYTKIGDLVTIQVAISGYSITSATTRTEFRTTLPFGTDTNNPAAVGVARTSNARATGYVANWTNTNNTQMQVAFNSDCVNSSGAVVIEYTLTYRAA